MIYTADIILPANTAKATPVVERLGITHGIIYKVEIQFPPGCSGLAHVVINDGGLQLWPSTPGKDFAADDYIISFDDTLFKQTAPYELQIIGYNLDETYDHVLQIRIGMVDQDIYIARYLPTVAFDHLIELMEASKKKEEAIKQAIIDNPFPYFMTEND